MLDQEKRTAILVLHGQDLSVRAIARACRASRSSVRAVIKSASAEVPRPERKEQAEPWRDEILSLYKDCKGNLVRVQAHPLPQIETAPLRLRPYVTRSSLSRSPWNPSN
jgi:transposase